MESLGDQNNPEEPVKAGNKGKAMAVVVPLLGTLVVVAGVVTALIGSTQPLEFGWVAYAPLANNPFSTSGAALVGPMTQNGYLIAVVGLLLLAFWAGHRLGRRTQ